MSELTAEVEKATQTLREINVTIGQCQRVAGGKNKERDVLVVKIKKEMCWW
jgi:hypothetical protein